MLYTVNDIWSAAEPGGMEMERSVKRLMEDREKRREENLGKYGSVPVIHT